MAFARAKVHWAKMDDVKLMTEELPTGKEHRKPELYYDSVLEGSRLVVECYLLSMRWFFPLKRKG